MIRNLLDILLKILIKLEVKSIEVIRSNHLINGGHTIHIKMKNKHNATNSIFHELYKNTKMDVKED